MDFAYCFFFTMYKSIILTVFLFCSCSKNLDNLLVRKRENQTSTQRIIPNDLGYNSYKKSCISKYLTLGTLLVNLCVISSSEVIKWDCLDAREECCQFLPMNFTYGSDLFECLKINYLDLNQSCAEYINQTLLENTPPIASQFLIENVNNDLNNVTGLYVTSR